MRIIWKCLPFDDIGVLSLSLIPSVSPSFFSYRWFLFLLLIWAIENIHESGPHIWRCRFLGRTRHILFTISKISITTCIQWPRFSPLLPKIEMLINETVNQNGHDSLLFSTIHIYKLCSLFPFSTFPTPPPPFPTHTHTSYGMHV